MTCPENPDSADRLLLDFGNTRLKWLRCASAGDAQDHAPIWARTPNALAWVHTEVPATIAACRAQLATLLPAWQGIRQAAFVGVAQPAWEAALQSLLAELGVSPQRVRASPASAGVVNAYREPGQLGADRWAAVVGAWQWHREHAPGQSALVVCAGTATTVDVCGAGGRFLGGTISPGWAMMRQSLTHGTARLPLAQGQWQAWPDNTDDAIETGIAHAQLGAVSALWQQVRERDGAPPKLWLTGGNAERLAQHGPRQAWASDWVLAPGLVLHGLNTLMDAL